MKPNFDIELLPEAIEFLEKLDTKSREKIYYNIKKLNEFIWEFRTLYNGKAFRLFSFWDKSGEQKTLVIATHGILKKTQKTPLKEIEKAEKIRMEYLIFKKENSNGK